MKAVKITITCLLLIVFSALLCCTILSWDYLTTEEKKEFTKAEMLANYELGIADEKVNSQNAISKLITNHNEELIKLENEKSSLMKELGELRQNKLTQEETIVELETMISDLNAEIDEIEKENQEMESYTIKIYAPDGDLYSTKSVRMNTTGYLPNYLEIDLNGFTAGNVEKWIIEYTDTEILTGEETQICQVLNAGELITINADMTFKAVSNGSKVLDVSIVDTGGFMDSKFTKVCENTLLSNIFSCSVCNNSTFQIQEEINGEWSEPITLNYSDINSYTITNNIKITHYHQSMILPNPNPFEPRNLW